MKSKRFLHYSIIIRHNSLYFQTYYISGEILRANNQIFIIIFQHLLHLYVVFTMHVLLTT